MFNGDKANRPYVVCEPPVPKPTLTPPFADMMPKIATLAMISAYVTYGVADIRPPYTPCGVRTESRPLRTHSGHWNPTEALFMQSGQIGRSQRTQRTWVSLVGWR